MSEQKDKKIEDDTKEDKTPTPEEKTSVTKHTISIKGKKLNYTVTAGTILLKEEDVDKGAKAKASIFYVAYTLDDVEDHATRPITFSFNGGPGSSSVWMHLGLLGPKRVEVPEDGSPATPPYELIENEFTMLDKTDLVFIDPVSTGYSRSVPGEQPDQFHGYKKDIESVGDFIHQYATRNHRWSCPKFIIGESYGTTRAAGLSTYLQDRHGMYLNGLMLISSILNFSTARFDAGNDLPYLLFLPTYTATAWYHNKLSPEFQKDLVATIAKVKDFAYNQYALALMQGSQLSDEERNDVAEKLAAFTGLTKEYVLQTDLRIEIFRFCKQLRRDESLAVGRLDSRFVGKDRDDAGEVFERDPSYSIILGPYAATMNQYVRQELEFENELPYEILAPLYQKWSYSNVENQYLNVAEELRKAIVTNPGLKVFVANGYFDFATPFFATEYTFNHMGLPKEYLDNISMDYYEAGHMMYVHLPSLVKVKKDLDNFIDQSK